MDDAKTKSLRLRQGITKFLFLRIWQHYVVTFMFNVMKRFHSYKSSISLDTSVLATGVQLWEKEK